jgi:HEAT repeat protein
MLFWVAFASQWALADGCFVWRWDKKVDINEPAQKAIILHDAGREDLLLQVKYEGPLDEFGWLVPVPSVPRVESGSMEAFYELSQLTQREFRGGDKGYESMAPATLGAGGPSVKVIEIKTVGDYEVSVLSARDAGSLARWLKAHDYSIPGGKSAIIDDYISRGWFFVAARISLNGRVGLRMAASAETRQEGAVARQRSAIQNKLAQGELHPLRISFDTPTCVFPLRISAVAGKPSEVSLYVLSEQPLVCPWLFNQAFGALDAEYARWVRGKPERERMRREASERRRALSLSFQLRGRDGRSPYPPQSEASRDWTAADLVAAANQGLPPEREWGLGEQFYADAEEVLRCLHVTSSQLSQSARSLPRLKHRSWYLTKQVKTFAPGEMLDLEFKPAIPALADALARPSGSVAAEVLAGLGSNAVPVLANACLSSNQTVRANATASLDSLRDTRLVEAVLSLLRDSRPQVRLKAVAAAEQNWDERFVSPLRALFSDPVFQIRVEAAYTLGRHEPARRAYVYVALLKDSSRSVRLSALRVLFQVNYEAIPSQTLSEMLRSQDAEDQAVALQAYWRFHRLRANRAELLPLLGSSSPDNVLMSLYLIQGAGSAPGRFGSSPGVSSSEAAPLLTNQSAVVRIAGLKTLRINGDARAVELLLPHLRETNSVVRSLAFETVREVTGQDISRNDPRKWEQWWSAHKANFVARPRGVEEQKREPYVKAERPIR